MLTNDPGTNTKPSDIYDEDGNIALKPEDFKQYEARGDRPRNRHERRKLAAKRRRKKKKQ